MAVVQMAPGRDGRGRFQPGCSGNPAGRRPGTLNHATRLKRLMADGDEEQFARQILDRARQGEWAALRFVFERLDPKPRQRSLELDLPEGADRLEMMERLFRAMADGEIAPDEALQVTRMIDKLDQARAAAAAKGGDLHSDCNLQDAARAPAPHDAHLNSTCIFTSTVAEAAPAVAPTQPSPTLRAGEGLKETAPRAADVLPQPETFPRAQHGGGQGGGVVGADLPALDDTYLNSTSIFTSSAAEAALTVAPAQLIPMLRTGEGLDERVPRASDAHLYSASIFTAAGPVGSQ